MYNVVMLIRYYCFLLLIHLLQANCERGAYTIPLVDDDCLGQRSRYVVNVDACRGYCLSVSVPEYSTINGVDTIKPVTHCKCCTAIEVESRTFRVKCRRRRGYKNFEVMSAVTCGCESCGPDTYQSRYAYKDNSKRKRNRSSGASFSDFVPHEGLNSGAGRAENDSESDLNDPGYLPEEPATDDSSKHSSRNPNFMDSDVLR